MFFEVSILGFLTISILLVFFIFFKNTIFGINFLKNKYNGVLLLREYILLIVLGVWAVYFLGIEKIPSFYVKSESLFLSSFLILLTLNIFLYFNLFISKYIFPNYFLDNYEIFDFKNAKNVLFIFSFFLLLIVILMHILGAKHAMISSFISGQDLLSERMANRYNSNVPTVLASCLKFIYIITTALLALSLNNKNIQFFSKILMLSLIFYSSTLYGTKAPLVNCILILFFGYLFSAQIKLNFFKLIKYGIPLLILSGGFIFYSTKIQFNDLDNLEIIQYIFMRISTGQMMGVYEQLDMKIISFDYIWRSVPFANFFLEYKEYSKDLMMATWGSYKDADEVGVMNSYFIGEAYAIGGMVFLILSPLIVSVNYCVSIYILILIFHKIFKLNKNFSIKVVALSLPFIFPLTGDIAGLIFFKFLVMYIIFLTPLIFFILYNRSLRR